MAAAEYATDLLADRDVRRRPHEDLSLQAHRERPHAVFSRMHRPGPAASPLRYVPYVLIAHAAILAGALHLVHGSQPVRPEAAEIAVTVVPLMPVPDTKPEADDTEPPDAGEAPPDLPPEPVQADAQPATAPAETPSVTQGSEDARPDDPYPQAKPTPEVQPVEQPESRNTAPVMAAKPVARPAPKPRPAPAAVRHAVAEAIKRALPPRAAPTGGGANTSNDAFLGRIRDAVQAAVRCPPSARMLGQSGTARVSFNYEVGLLPGSVEIVQSTGTPALDRAALRAVRDARMPSAPPEVGNTVQHLAIRIVEACSG